MAYFYNGKADLYNGRIIDKPNLTQQRKDGSNQYSAINLDPEFDLDLSGNGAQKPVLNSTIYTFQKRRNRMYGRLRHAVKPMLGMRQARRTFAFILLNIFVMSFMFSWCGSSNSLALRSFTYLNVFDFLTLITCLISTWASTTQRSNVDNCVQIFSYERIEVLLVFASVVLTSLGSIFILKEMILRIIEQPDIAVGRLLPGALLGLLFHVLVTVSIKNKPLQCVTEASSSSLIQEHVSDLSQPLCNVIPVLNNLLLPRVNPFFLLSVIGAALVLFTDILIQIDLYFMADTVSSLLLSLATLSTMWPVAVCSAQILLNTTPTYVLGQLDKLLSEAQTLDGVLEILNERFFTVALASKTHTDLRCRNGFGLIMAGSVSVRVRRDANEQMVLAHVTNRLSPLVAQLTVQVVKDEWSSGSFASTGIPSNIGLKPSRSGSAILYGFNKPAAAVAPYQQIPPKSFTPAMPVADAGLTKLEANPVKIASPPKRADDFSFSSTPSFGHSTSQSLPSMSKPGSNIARMYKAAGFTSPPPAAGKGTLKLPSNTTKRVPALGDTSSYVQNLSSGTKS